jgi:hypothetical protein
MEERGLSMLSLGRFNSGGGGAKEIESFLRGGISGEEAADVIRERLLTKSTKKRTELFVQGMMMMMMLKSFCWVSD